MTNLRTLLNLIQESLDHREGVNVGSYYHTSMTRMLNEACTHVERLTNPVTGDLALFEAAAADALRADCTADGTRAQLAAIRLGLRQTRLNVGGPR